MNNNIYSGPQAQYVPQPVVKEKPEYTKTEIILSVFTFIAGFFLVRYVGFHVMGFITTATFIALITAEIVYLRKKECSFSGFNKVLAGVLYLFSTVFSITSNNYIKVLDILFIIGAGAYMVYSVGAGNKSIERFLPYAILKAIFEYPFNNFDKQFAITSDRISNSKAGSNVKYIIIGLVLTLPLTAVVAALLMSADDGMERMLNEIFDKIFREDIWNIILQLCLAIPCSMYLFGMFYSNTHSKYKKPLSEQGCTQSLFKMRFISNLIVYTAVTPICVLYVLFFISQTSYFLSAFMNDLPEGFTYADYARKGFFELFAVAVINLIVLCGMSLFSKKAGKEKPKALKFYCVTLSVFTIILIATAMSKMVMYIDNYGLTELRVYTSWFMILLAITFVMIIIKQFKFDMKFAKHFAIMFTVMFAILCFSRPEAFIAKYNIEMYNSGYLDELDMNAILHMSDDGLLVALNEGVATADEVNDHKRHLSERDTFGKYNIPALIVDSKTE